jgi:hypothetical protein
MRTRLLVACVAAIATAVGIWSYRAAAADAPHEKHGGNGEKVAIRDVPHAVRATIRREADGAKIKSVDKASSKGRTVYKAEAEIDGDSYAIIVAESGQLISKRLAGEEAEMACKMMGESMGMAASGRKAGAGKHDADASAAKDKGEAEETAASGKGHDDSAAGDEADAKADAKHAAHKQSAESGDEGEQEHGKARLAGSSSSCSCDEACAKCAPKAGSDEEKTDTPKEKHQHD